MEPGGQPGQLDAGRMPGQGFDQHAAPPGVDRAHVPQVPVVPAGLQQRGHHELVQAGRAAVADPFRLRDGIDQRRAEPHGGGQGLAHRADGEDPVRR